MRSTYELRRECERINKLLLDDAKRQGLGTRQSRKRLEDARHDDSNAFTYWAQLEYREYIRRQLEHHDTVSASHLVRNGAYMIGISTITARRYLSALASKDGPFKQHGELVMINYDYIPDEANPYWQDDEIDKENA